MTASVVRQGYALPVPARLAAWYRRVAGAVLAVVRSDVHRAVFVGGVLWLAVGLWLALISLLAPELRNARPPGPVLDDFGVFYSAGRMVREGHGDQLYDLRALAREEARTYERRPAAPALPYFNPPPFAGALAPLTLLGFSAAAAIFLAVSSAFFLISLFALWRESALGYVSAWLACAMALTYQAVQEVLFHGQVAFLLLFFFTAAFAAFAARRDRLGGCLLGLLLLKPNLLVVPLVVLAWKRRWGALLGFAAMALVWAGAAALIAGPDILRRYPESLHAAATWDDKNGIGIIGMFGWNALVRSYLGPGHQELVNLWSLALAIPTMLLILWAWRGPWPAERRALALRYSALVTGALLVNPHVYRTDMVLMMIPAFLLIGAVEGRARLLVSAAFTGAWLLFLYHYPILRALGWNLTVPVMAVLLVLAALMTLRRRIPGVSPEEVADDPALTAPVLQMAGELA